MELTKYCWWGSSNEPPEHLKTKKQLSELGLAPLKAVGVIETRKYDVLLYDTNNPECCRPKRKPTQKQLETLAANRLKAQIKRDYWEWYREVGFIERDRVILNYCCYLHGLPILKFKKRSECLMEWAAQWGGDWSNYYKDYRYFPLPSGNHRALGDCLAALDLLKKMAADSIEINCPVPIPQKEP